VGSLLFGVAFLAVYTMWVWRQPEPVTWVTSVAVWVFVIAAMLFEVVNRRDTWRPRDRSTRAFLELSQLQLVRRLRGFRFGWLLLGAETLFFVPWIASTVAAAADGTPAPAEYLGPYSLLAAMVGGVAVGLWGLTKRARRELERVRSLHAWLADESRAA
jgi:hypothetical protein